MKMGFLSKNNARRGMGEKIVLKKGSRKRPPKFANSKTDGRLGGNSQILKAWEKLSNGCKQHALKGQKLLAQGIALGNYGRNLVAL